jgi:hypothetical protein
MPPLCFFDVFLSLDGIILSLADIPLSRVVYIQFLENYGKLRHSRSVWMVKVKRRPVC